MISERRVRLVVVLGAILAPLNSTMLAVALPGVIAEFGADVATAGWLMTAYLLALAVVQPVAGKLGDRFGRRGFMLGGLAVFGLASLGAAMAPSLPVLIAMRTAQAVAGAVVFPNGAGLLRQVIPAERRGRAFGTMGALLSLAAALGPPLGGVIVTLGGWRAIFLVNLPVILAALVLGGRAIPRHEAAEGRAARFDTVGAVALPALLLGVALLVIEGRHLAAGWMAAAAGLGLAGLAGWFVLRELGHADPVFQPRFFARRGFAAAVLGVASKNLGFYTLLLAVPILLARQGGSSLGAGLALMLLSAPMVACSALGGHLADRMGRRGPVVAGCVLLALGILPLALFPGVSGGVLLGCLVVAGAGVGLGSAGMQAAAVEAVEARHAGVAAGLFSTCRYIGSFVGSIFLARLLGEGMDGFQALFAVALAGAVVSIGAALALPKVGGSR